MSSGSIILVCLSVHLVATLSPQEYPAGPGGPRIIGLSQNVTVYGGETIRIDCEVADIEPFVLVWTRGSVLILFAGQTRVDPDPRYSVNGSTLVIRDAQQRDFGQFRCMLNTNPPQVVEHYVQVLGHARKVPDVDKVYVRSGGSTELFCEDAKNRSIMWYHKSSKNDPSETFLRTAQRLFIQNFTSEMSGLYVCRASEGNANEKFELVLKSPPQVILDKEDILNVTIGDRFAIECAVKAADEETLINWFETGTGKFIGKNGPVRTSRALNDDTIIASLIFEPFFRAREGNYTCHASNSMGHSYETVLVKARSEPALRADISLRSNVNYETILLASIGSLIVTLLAVVIFVLLLRRSGNRVIKERDGQEMTLAARKDKPGVTHAKTPSGSSSRENVYEQINYADLERWSKSRSCLEVI